MLPEIIDPAKNNENPTIERNPPNPKPGVITSTTSPTNPRVNKSWLINDDEINPIILSESFLTVIISLTALNPKSS